jgi:cytochrome c oxidase subunit 2
MVPESDLELGQLRLLEVDSAVVLPIDTHVRFLITSSDVLHDFALPAGGIKLDAAPGRLNQASLLSDRATTLTGQCSELCGVYHGFMPIVVNIVNVEEYLS